MTALTPRRAQFEPRLYLDDYFLDVNEEYDGLYQFWCDAAQAMPEGLRALELGVGPTIYSTIPLSARFSEVHLADFVPESLVEIERWRRREAGCFDWRPHVQRVLQIEGKEGNAAETYF